jgi:hypothetical protein
MLDNRRYSQVATELRRQGWELESRRSADFWKAPDGVHSATWAPYTVGSKSLGELRLALPSRRVPMAAAERTVNR